MRRLAAILCALLLASAGLWAAGESVSVAMRLEPGGEARALVVVTGSVTEVTLRQARGAALAAGPPEWQAEAQGDRLRLRGPRTSGEARFYLRIPARRLPETLRASAGDFNREAPVAELPAPEKTTDLDGLLALPSVIAPGERVQLRALDPRRTPLEGTWAIAGAELAKNGNGWDWTVPRDVAAGAIAATYRDPWGDATVEAQQEIEVDRRDYEGIRPRVIGCEPYAPAGGPTSVCGYFPGDSRQGLLLDGQPIGEALTASLRAVAFRVAAQTTPGAHVISGDPAMGFPASDQVILRVFRVEGGIDQRALSGADSTPLRMRIVGVTEPIEIELTNRSPDLISLEGGDHQTAMTTGGEQNTLERLVRKVAYVPGRTRDFSLGFRIRSAAKACDDALDLTEDRDGFLPAQALAAIALDTPAAMNAVAQAIAAALGLNVVAVDPLPAANAGLATFQIPDARTVPVVVAALAANAQVLFAQPNFSYAMNGQTAMASAAPDPYDRLVWGRGAVGADEIEATGRGVSLAVIDTGVDADNVELADRVKAKEDFTGNGFSADIHGTQVAGVIAAKPGNGIGISGVAPDVDLLALKACQPFSPRAVQARCWSSAMAKALNYGIERKASVLNLSVGSQRDDRVVRSLIDAAGAGGLVVVAAAGNDGPGAAPTYPAALDSVIAVTAVDTRQNLYVHATRGDYVDLAAPGVEIVSTGPGGIFPVCSGTSFAAPYVSATAALLLEISRQLSALDVRRLLLGSAHDLGAAGADAEFGAGLLDACRAAQAAGARLACR